MLHCINQGITTTMLKKNQNIKNINENMQETGMVRENQQNGRSMSELK